MSLDEARFRAIISGQATGAAAEILRPILRAASWPYGLAAAARRKAYARGWKRSYAAGVPVISVGNITTGGTGKTPLAAWVVAQLKALGRRPAVLIRGYRGRDAHGDEAELLARLTGSPVVVNPDRLAGAGAAVAGGADVLVMDDGFQHLRLRRDLDIVTIDATCPFGHEALLPRGLLREPPTALRRAHALVITRCDQVDAAVLAAVRERLGRLAPGVPRAETVVRPTGLCGADGTREPATALAGRTAWAFCGLGNPESFYGTLADQDLRLVGRTTFNDHHAYSPADVRNIIRQADAAGAELVITSAKDAVRLPPTPAPPAQPIRWLEIELEFHAGLETLQTLLARAVGR